VTLLSDARQRLTNTACALFFGTNNTDTRDQYYTALDALTAALHEEGGTWPASAPSSPTIGPTARS
jgi:hypothetical protein